MFSGLFGKKDKKKNGLGEADDLDAFESSVQHADALDAKSAPGPLEASQQRTLAKNTVAKINAIEHEMSLDFARTTLGSEQKKAQQAESTISPVLSMPSAAQSVRPQSKDLDNGPPTLPPLDASTAIILGNDSGDFAVEISTSRMPAVLEETAILYANGQGLAALHVLLDAIKQDDLGAHTQQAWHMLFELYQSLNKQSEFESLALDYVSRFESSPPTWQSNADGDNKKSADLPNNNNNANVVIGNKLDATFSKYIDQIKRYATRMTLIRLDFTKAQQIDEIAAKQLIELFVLLKQHKNITFEISGLHALVPILEKMIETGRKDADDTMWLLYLDMLGLLGKVEQFEEACLNYCITYEVSPPSYVPPPSHFRLGEKLSATVQTAQQPIYASDPIPDTFALTGILEGKTDSILARLMAFASTRQKIDINCKALARVDFSAAGALLNSVVNLQANNKKIIFSDLSFLISALFITMGIHEFSSITTKRV